MSKRVPILAYLDGEITEIGTVEVNADGVLSGLISQVIFKALELDKNLASFTINPMWE